MSFFCKGGKGDNPGHLCSAVDAAEDFHGSGAVLVKAASDAGRHFARLCDKDIAIDNDILDERVMDCIALFLQIGGSAEKQVALIVKKRRLPRGRPQRLLKQSARQQSAYLLTES